MRDCTRTLIKLTFQVCNIYVPPLQTFFTNRLWPSPHPSFDRHWAPIHELFIIPEYIQNASIYILACSHFVCTLYLLR